MKVAMKKIEFDEILKILFFSKNSLKKILSLTFIHKKKKFFGSHPTNLTGEFAKKSHKNW